MTGTARKSRVAPIVTAIGFSLSVFYAEAGVDVGTGSSFTSATKLIPMAIMGVGVLLLIAGPVTRPVSRPMTWWWALMAWEALCAAFAAYPTLSLLRVVQSVIPMVAAFTLVRRGRDPMWLIAAVLAACTAHVVYTLQAGAFVGVLGAQRLVGLLIANTFALAAAITIVISVGLWQAQLLPRAVRWLPIPLVLASGWAVYLTVGRTASIAIPTSLVIGAVLFGRRAEGKVPMRRIALLGTMLVAAVFVARRFGEAQSWFVTGNDNITTLTGRTTIWHAIVTDLAPASPIVGYGPGAMRFRVPAVQERLGSLIELASAHSSFFETLLNAGYIGAALWVVAMFSTFAHAVKMRSRRRPVATSLMAALTVFSFTIPSMAGFGIGWYALVAAVALVSAEGEQKVRVSAAATRSRTQERFVDPSRA